MVFIISVYRSKLGFQNEKFDSERSYFGLKDHLGNTRAVVKGTQAAPVLMQEFHYYPFGMQMEGAWVTPTGLDQKYKYNGKELVDDLGLNWYDYGARWYDPSVARWMQVDPMAEGYAGMSPYNYGMNNPVNVVDPSGMAAEWIGPTARKSTKTPTPSNAVSGLAVLAEKHGEGEERGEEMQGEMAQPEPSKEKDSNSTNETEDEGSDSNTNDPLPSGKKIYEPGGWEEYGSLTNPAFDTYDPNLVIDLDLDEQLYLLGHFLGLSLPTARIARSAILAEGVVATKEVSALRAAYVSEVEGLSSVASKMRATGSSSEEIARSLHGLRRELGVKYKSLTPDNVLQPIYQRNLQKYGDKLGPTIDYLRQQGKSWDDIINSATRPGGKDLGF